MTKCTDDQYRLCFTGSEHAHALNGPIASPVATEAKESMTEQTRENENHLGRKKGISRQN
jgi:hypothetical protein